MTRPLRVEYPGAFYHVFNRGLEKRKIFLYPQDYRKFLSLGFELYRKYQILFHAYCLMPNHYHLMVETPLGNLPRAMRHLNGLYTQFFNRQYQRVGPLFQGRYRAILVEKENYAQELSRYLHLNPVKAGLCRRPEDYPFSSYPVYLGLSPAPRFLATDWLLGQFDLDLKNARAGFHQFTSEGMGLSWDPVKVARGRFVLGSETFLKGIQEKFIRRLRSKEYTGLRVLTHDDKEEIIRQTIKQFHCEPTVGSKLLIYALRRFSPLNLEEIRKKTGASSYAAVSKTVSRLEVQRKEDKELDQMLKAIEEKLEEETSNV